MPVFALCTFPERVHPVSAGFLEDLLVGSMAPPLFQRFFSLPNSDYIDLAACIVAAIAGT